MKLTKEQWKGIVRANPGVPYDKAPRIPLLKSGTFKKSHRVEGENFID